jgi:hypothetical protein
MFLEIKRSMGELLISFDYYVNIDSCSCKSTLSLDTNRSSAFRTVSARAYHDYTIWKYIT